MVFTNIVLDTPTYKLQNPPLCGLFLFLSKVVAINAVTLFSGAHELIIEQVHGEFKPVHDAWHTQGVQPEGGVVPGFLGGAHCRPADGVQLSDGPAGRLAQVCKMPLEIVFQRILDGGSVSIRTGFVSLFFVVIIICIGRIVYKGFLKLSGGSEWRARWRRGSNDSR